MTFKTTIPPSRLLCSFLGAEVVKRNFRPSKLQFKRSFTIFSLSFTRSFLLYCCFFQDTGGICPTTNTDFLPFVCSVCSGVYCLEHRSRASHGCPEDSTRSDMVKLEGLVSHPCTFKGCNEKELILVLCPSCDKHFCLRHRHQSDHECEKLESPKPRMAATQQLVQEIVASKKSNLETKGRKRAKISETAAKVALMKLKLHAAGEKSLPQSERIYFQVFLPKDSKEKSRPMFFCSKWSIGKVIDFAASLANLKNDNNKSTAKKLRLCHVTSGEALPLDHTLESWVSNVECPLYNGGNIILEYLDNDCTALADASSYLS
ncbi:AN1-type zinc finger protein 1 isoform X2 [Rhinatrema bivittatum]|uniref:AN1-type zinc finger protein 1 isoform X2 n=1 Tax=Rhinatrema bivittatum TaxID=194408 RepID=UPI00112CE646|nr:AN1-type zinc finger protein 1 isoform X2 [Rhinatrema bivittatum]